MRALGRRALLIVGALEEQRDHRISVVYMLELVSVEMPRQIAEQLKLTYSAKLTGSHPSLPASFTGTYGDVHKAVERFGAMNGLGGTQVHLEIQVKLELGEFVREALMDVGGSGRAVH